ncbi:uncharacterized protein PGTG_15311 [Puccinia graminis f. sp. tritici CRL 75-36-700-3]|uniref:Uncharacterized protein n=1 Tax=Puccinia graminis f. sp. tritici (strain CRL 75-36-700-3 / race SCCL) TaxID=418459 RepID=E3KYS3_PUCGT|nr:uncharacterized protein PGTG_15311 [Puccinia graminis f. sp. tritici CRL 75-36-700-3]EFP89469.1 hypothetical protein PGTG_15311 [Puccinia graminis f. sp. tritici CRL 75-36-700-3]
MSTSFGGAYERLMSCNQNPPKKSEQYTSTSKTLQRMSDMPRRCVRAKSVTSCLSLQSYNPQEEGGSQGTPSTQPPSESEQAPDDQEELLRAQRVAQSSVSSTYSSFREPELLDQRDKHGRHMISYPCKLCGTWINRLTSDSSCSNLNKHALLCYCKHNESQKMQSLANLGITRTGDINPKEFWLYSL